MICVLFLLTNCENNAGKNSALCTKCRKDVLNYSPAIESQTLEESQSQIFSDISSNHGSTYGNFGAEDSIDVTLEVSPVKKKPYVYYVYFIETV